LNEDILLNKTETILRCIQRIHEEYAGDDANLHNYTKQDSIILNLQRACEACIDLAMHIISEKQWGIPQNSRDAFTFLQEHKVIDEQMSTHLKAMVGFRNIAVHDYRTIQITIVQSIINYHLVNFSDFTQTIRQYMRNSNE
jgi:uncharacterized protein YutE (UPF0331/DUF86 family)